MTKRNFCSWNLQSHLMNTWQKLKFVNGKNTVICSLTLIKVQGFDVTLTTVEVGSRGVISDSLLSFLQECTSIRKKQSLSLIDTVAHSGSILPFSNFQLPFSYFRLPFFLLPASIFLLPASIFPLPASILQ